MPRECDALPRRRGASGRPGKRRCSGQGVSSTWAVSGWSFSEVARPSNFQFPHQFSVQAVSAANGEALAEAAATGPYLDSLLEAAPRPEPERTFATAVIDVVRDPDDFQARPRLSVAMAGTRDGDAWSSTFHVLATTVGARIEREVPAD